MARGNVDFLTMTVVFAATAAFASPYLMIGLWLFLRA